jgi:uncharacterized membrane protein YesL
MKFCFKINVIFILQCNNFLIIPPKYYYMYYSRGNQRIIYRNNLVKILIFYNIRSITFFNTYVENLDDSILRWREYCSTSIIFFI